MELLLNLTWLILALPAWWLWRSSSRAPSRFSSIQCLLALGCALVVLFPVISATDDLHVMRAEIEESPSSKRNFCPSASEKPSPWSARVQAPPAILNAAHALSLGSESHDPAPNLLISLPPAPVLHIGRAPPAPRLA
jgi:hypothetical protein